MIISKGTITFDLSAAYYECLQLACLYIFKHNDAYELTPSSLTITGKHHIQEHLFFPFLFYFVKEYGTLKDGKMLIKRSGPNGMLSYGEITVKHGNYVFQPFLIQSVHRTCSYDDFQSSLSLYQPEDYQTLSYEPSISYLLDEWCFGQSFHSFSLLHRDIKRNGYPVTLLVGNEIIDMNPESNLVQFFQINRSELASSLFDDLSPNKRYLDFFRLYTLDSNENRTLSYKGKTVPLFEPIMWLLQELESTCNQCVNRLKRITTGCDFCLPKRTNI